MVDAAAHPYLVRLFFFFFFFFFPCRDVHIRQSSVKNCFVRGSTVRYIHIPKELVDVELLQDATRLEAREAKKATAER